MVLCGSVLLELAHMDFRNRGLYENFVRNSRARGALDAHHFMRQKNEIVFERRNRQKQRLIETCGIK